MNSKISQKKLLGIRLSKSFLWGVVLTIILESILIIGKNLSNFISAPINLHTFLAVFLSFRLSITILLLAFISAMALLLYYFGMTICNFIYRYRYFFVILVAVLCIIFEISGSSIGVWQQYLPNSKENNDFLLFGIPRPIRTDEWLVSTPMAFSQALNSTSAFPYFSEVLRGTTTDAFVVYGQPVLHLAAIFRPFYFGYLIFGLAKGLSFFWITRLIGLFIVSFELGMILTQKNKRLSFALAILIDFAPVVQWWFAINGFVEMLTFGELAVLIIYFYMKTDKYLIRIFLALGFVICGGAFILTFYPSWQIPMFYIFLALSLGIILKYRKNFLFLYKKDLPIIGMSVIVLLTSMSLIFIKSADTIKAVLNTVYPGERIETGGGQLINLFSYPSNLYTSFCENGIVSNPVEMSLFFSLFPLGLLITLWVIFKEKQKDIILICLLCVDIFLTIYCIVPWPEFLAKVTLLSKCQSSRVIVPVTLLNLFLLFRSCAIIKSKVRFITAFCISLFLGILVTFFCHLALPTYIFGKIMLGIIFVVLTFGFCVFICAKNSGVQNILVIYCCIISLIGGFLVNPVYRGIEVIEKNPLVSGIRNIVEDDGQNGKWITVGLHGNVPILAGAPTINSINTYPNIELWHILDPNNLYENIYNRYAHISFDLMTDSPTYFKLNYLDSFTVYLNIDDLEKIGVKYILSSVDLKTLGDKMVSFIPIESYENYIIYKVNYI